MRLTNIIGFVFGSAAFAQLAFAQVPVAAEGSEEPVILALASFSEDNVFGQIVNGERNQIFVQIENLSDRNVTIKSIAGSFHDPNDNRLVKNTTGLTYEVPLLEGSKIQLPYSFHSEFKPGELKLNIWLDHAADGHVYRVTAYDSIVTIVEPEGSWFDPKLWLTYLIVLSILGGAGYVAYQVYAPQPKRKTPRTVAVSAPIGTVTATGAGGYQEEWIPEHHLKKPKAKRTKSGALTSGDETSGAELSGTEGRKRKTKK